MYINLQTLIKLPVFTESGQKVGVVHDLEIDLTSHAIRHYIVEHGIIGKESYWVSPVQIKSVDEEKIVVEDAILTDPEFKLTKREAPPAVAGGPVAG